MLDSLTVGLGVVARLTGHFFTDTVRGMKDCQPRKLRLVDIYFLRIARCSGCLHPGYWLFRVMCQSIGLPREAILLLLLRAKHGWRGVTTAWVPGSFQ